jgi:diguanylate cyclase (GGDEF)-like protein
LFTVLTMLVSGGAMAAPPALAGQAAATEAGLPFIHNFVPAEYGGAPQNWAITQGLDGVIYVGNVEDGVLTFDGTRWRRIPVPSRLTVRSLATGPEGRIYVGTVGDFGYLEADASGRLAFASLLHLVPAGERGFSDVWDIHVTGEGVFFETSSRIFHLRDDRITVIKPHTSFHLGFLVDGTVYIREIDRGLMRVVGDKLQPVAGGELFADKRIYALLPWRGEGARPGQLLAGTRSEGWFLFDGAGWKPHPMATDDALKEAAVYGAIWLADGRLAVATLRGGLFLLDADGRLLLHLARATGLDTNVVLGLMQDRQFGLWLATDNGIARVDVDAPLTHFGERNGLQGAVLAMIRHRGTLFAGTSEGLFRLVANADGVAHFERQAGVAGWNFSLLSFGDQLLAANNDGVFSVGADGSARALLDSHGAKHALTAQSLLRSRLQPSRVFVGYQDGVGTLRWTGSQWLDEGLVSGAPGQATSFGQDAEGRLWIARYPDGFDRLTLPSRWQGPNDPRPVKIEHFDSGAGLPAGPQATATVDGEMRFATSKGVYRFDEPSRRFVPDAALENLFPGGPRQITALYQDHLGALWMYTIDDSLGIKETGRARRVHGRWKWTVTPLQPISGTGIYAFQDDPDGVVWLGGDKGLFRYTTTRAARGDVPFSALIREVSAHDGRVRFADRPDKVPEVPYAQNALRFEFAAPSYDFSGANRFQVLLQGIDRNWSPWSDDAYRDYTNIHEGEYRFRVRARNVYGEEGTEATFDFRVLPPWYRAPWAWAIWIASGLLVIALLLRWRSAALRRRNRELAALVEQRTTELRTANAALAEQSVTDPLTGLKNRRYLYDHIAQDIAMARRNSRDRHHGHPELPLNSEILFLMVDIDHFKQINDTYGHAAGDRVLQQFRDLLLSVTRETDIPIRWGGEEFLIVARFALPDVGPQYAERIRAAVAAHPFELDEGRSIDRTCSIGFATYPIIDDQPDCLTWEQVVNLADECLYAAKRHGRNAWVGVMPLPATPDGEVIDALRSSLARLPDTGPLPIRASWVQPV